MAATPLSRSCPIRIISVHILDPADVIGLDYPSETFRVLKSNAIRQFVEYRTQRLELEAVIEAEWQSGKESASANRTIFAQRSLKPEQALREWDRARESLGSAEAIGLGQPWDLAITPPALPGSRPAPGLTRVSWRERSTDVSSTPRPSAFAPTAPRSSAPCGSRAIAISPSSGYSNG